MEAVDTGIKINKSGDIYIRLGPWKKDLCVFDYWDFWKFWGEPVYLIHLNYKGSSWNFNFLAKSSLPWKWPSCFCKMAHWYFSYNNLPPEDHNLGLHRLYFTVKLSYFTNIFANLFIPILIGVKYDIYNILTVPYLYYFIDFLQNSSPEEKPKFTYALLPGSIYMEF